MAGFAVLDFETTGLPAPAAAACLPTDAWRCVAGGRPASATLPDRS